MSEYFEGHPEKDTIYGIVVVAVNEVQQKILMG